MEEKTEEGDELSDYTIGYRMETRDAHRMRRADYQKPRETTVKPKPTETLVLSGSNPGQVVQQDSTPSPSSG